MDRQNTDQPNTNQPIANQQASDELNVEQLERAFEDIFKGLPEETQACILSCIQCHEVCEQVMQYCLSKGAAYAEPRRIRLVQDCSEICVVGANFIVRGSEFFPHMVNLCAEVCMQCAASFEEMPDDEMMRGFADACRRTAESCQRIAVQH